MHDGSMEELNAEIISDNPAVAKYVVRPSSRPKIVIVSEKNEVTITRSVGLFRKQVFKFPKFLDHGVDELATVFSRFYYKFITREAEINNTQALKDLLHLFEDFNIFTLPSLVRYIQKVMTADGHMYVRFMTMISNMESLVDPKVKSYINWCYLKGIINFTTKFNIPTNENRQNHVESIVDREPIHEFLDMMILIPWSYLFYVYKFNKYSGLQDKLK